MCIHDIIFLFIESNKLMNNLQIANDNFRLYYCIKLHSGNLYIEYQDTNDFYIFYITSKLSEQVIQDELNRVLKNNNINIVFRINGGSYYKRISIINDEYRNKFINFLYNQKLCFYDKYTDIMLNTNIFHNKRHTSSLSSFSSIIDTIFVNNKLINYTNSNFENNITIFFKSELFEMNDI